MESTAHGDSGGISKKDFETEGYIRQTKSERTEKTNQTAPANTLLITHSGYERFINPAANYPHLSLWIVFLFFAFLGSFWIP